MKLSEAIRKGKAEDGEQVRHRLFQYAESGQITGSCAIGYAVYAVLAPEERNKASVLGLLGETYEQTARALALLRQRGVEGVDDKVHVLTAPCCQAHVDMGVDAYGKPFDSHGVQVMSLNDGRDLLSADAIIERLEKAGL